MLGVLLGSYKIPIVEETLEHIIQVGSIDGWRAPLVRRNGVCHTGPLPASSVKEPVDVAASVVHVHVGVEEARVAGARPRTCSRVPLAYGG